MAHHLQTVIAIHPSVQAQHYMIVTKAEMIQQAYDLIFTMLGATIVAKTYKTPFFNIDKFW